MASGTINGTTSSQYCISKIEWTSTPDEQANESTVTAKLYLRRTNNYTTYGEEWAFTINIAGKKTSVSDQSLTIKQEWVLALTATATVEHNGDGSKSITISASGGNSGTSVSSISCSGTATLDTIPRATTIDSLSCATKYFTGKLSYKYTPQSSSFYNRCNISLNLDGTYIAVKSINLGKQSASQKTATVTLSADELSTIYNELPKTDKGKLRFTFRTYSDSGYSTQIGDAGYKEISLYIPEDSTTKPTATMTLSPVSSMESPFDSLYIMGRTKVDANFTNGDGKYGAGITSYKMSVGGNSYGSPWTSGYLSTTGEVEVTGIVTDSRGFTREYTQTITVIAYGAPKLLAASGEIDVVAARCDEDGTFTDSGTYLKIKAKRSYYKVISDGEQYNFCQIRFRYKLESAASYSAWTTILARDSLGSDEIVTGALLGSLSAQSTYLVQVQVIDDMEESASTTITVPTDKAYWHRDGARNSFTFGGYVEEDNTFAIAGGVDFKVKSLTGETVVVSDTGWIDLGLNTDTVSESGSNVGRNGKGCYYRVINGNHVYVAFNCACEFANELLRVNLNAIPEQYCPARNAYALVPTGGRSIVRTIANHDGLVLFEWVQIMSSAEQTTEANVKWIDGYIDYWV